MFYEPFLSLHENLVCNGFTHYKVGVGSAHAIFCGRKEIYRGCAVDVTEWLQELATVAAGQ